MGPRDRRRLHRHVRAVARRRNTGARVRGASRRRIPVSSAQVRLLMIGDGATLPAVRRILDEHGAAGSTVFTGLVSAGARARVPRRVRHPRGAARAEPGWDAVFRIADQAVRVHGDGQGHRRLGPRSDWRSDRARTNRVAGPARKRRGARNGSPNARRRCRTSRSLGAAARARVLERHTWREHTRRTIETLQQRAG